MKTCQAQVPDHTDHTDCGKPVVRAERCSRHISEEVDELRDDNFELRTKIRKNNARIKQLLGK